MSAVVQFPRLESFLSGVAYAVLGYAFNRYARIPILECVNHYSSEALDFESMNKNNNNKEKEQQPRLIIFMVQVP